MPVTTVALARAILRIVPVLVLLQITSLPRLVAEVYGDDDCCEHCDDAAPSQKCPPLCPTCTCAHVNQLMPPAPTPRSNLDVPSVPLVAERAAQAPVEPDPQRIFHAPRA